MIGKIILAITGIGAGFIISAGVFALITSTGIITRFADKTHTAKSIQLYETIVIAGGILWNIFWVMESRFKFTGQPAKIFQGIMGLCQSANSFSNAFNKVLASSVSPHASAASIT